MKNELRDVFAQGNAELMNTAGEDAELVRMKGGNRISLRVVVSPSERALELPGVGGAILRCDRTAVISADEPTRKPEIGDMLAIGGEEYEIMTVTGWAFGASWVADIALRQPSQPHPRRYRHAL